MAQISSPGTSQAFSQKAYRPSLLREHRAPQIHRRPDGRPLRIRPSTSSFLSNTTHIDILSRPGDSSRAPTSMNQAKDPCWRIRRCCTHACSARLRGFEMTISCQRGGVWWSKERARRSRAEGLVRWQSSSGSAPLRAVLRQQARRSARRSTIRGSTLRCCGPQSRMSTGHRASRTLRRIPPRRLGHHLQDDQHPPQRIIHPRDRKDAYP